MDKHPQDFQVSCTNCNLDAICLPRGLSAQEVEDLSIVVNNNSILQRGEFIYRQGEDFKGIIAIKSGVAKLLSCDEQGNEHILNILLPGELVGFDGLNHHKHSCSVVALNAMAFCVIPAEKIDKLCVAVPSIARELFRHSGDIINDTQSLIISSKRPAEQKLALFLINLSARLKRRGFSSLNFDLPLTREELGNHLGLTLETVSRMLQQLQSDGVIKVQRKNIEIIALQVLKNISVLDKNK